MICPNSSRVCMYDIARENVCLYASCLRSRTVTEREREPNASVYMQAGRGIMDVSGAVCVCRGFSGRV